MPTIYELAKTFRASLLKREAKTSAQILATFQTVLTNLQPKIDALQKELENNPEITLARVLRLNRYKELQSQTKAEIERFAAAAARITAAAQGANAQNGFREAREFIIRQTNSFVKLPSRAVQSFVGLASDGSPLEKIFAEISNGAVKAVKDKITVSIALGHNPRKLAGEIRRSFGTPAARALTVARTESLRSYKTASLETYRENSKLLGGWIWLSARSQRTCAMCFAMDGTHHELREEFGSHANCRCSPLPDLGKPLPQTGAEVFAELPDEKQREILGAGKFELYKTDKLKLGDLVETRNDARWGKVRFEKSLKNL